MPGSQGDGRGRGESCHAGVGSVWVWCGFGGDFDPPDAGDGALSGAAWRTEVLAGAPAVTAACITIVVRVLSWLESGLPLPA